MSLPDEAARLLAIAKDAALAVDEQLRAAFRSTMDYTYKRDLHDIVTEHDKASEARIRAVIMAGAPDSTIIGEEGGEQGTGRVRWYVDPIDGTANFARGLAHWCVSIAAAIDGRIVAGVVFDPVARNLFSADLGGAYLNGVTLTAKAFPDEHKATLIASFPSARHIKLYGQLALDGQAELLNAFLSMRNLGSAALNLASVAAGWADATMGFKTSPWDVAAGLLIVEQAGGRYVGLRDGANVDQAFMAPDYMAFGKGVSYPTLDRVVAGLSRAAARAA